MATDYKLVGMATKLELMLEESVQKTIQHIEGKYAVLLSGGVDSGLLASLSFPEVALTCRFPYGKKYDEFEYAKKTAKYLKLKQEVITVTKKDFFKYLPNALKAYKPTRHFSLVPLYMLFKKANDMGIKTVISAEGPDEYLGGYSAYSFITHEQELYKKEELKNYHPALDKYLGSPMERFARVLGKEPKQLKPYWGKYKNLLSKMGYCDLKLRGIEDMELAIAKHFGITLLYPFMTKKVEEFCFKEVPDEMKIQGMTTKYIERMVAAKYIPRSVAWRKNKMGGPVAPIGRWLGEKDEFAKTKYLQLQNKLWKKYR